MQEDTNAKEDYLTRKEIEKGIKRDDLLEFLKNKKEQGNDLNNWKLEDLKEQVDNYNQMKDSKTLNEENAPYAIDQSIKLPIDRKDMSEEVKKEDQEAEIIDNDDEESEDIVVIEDLVENTNDDANRKEMEVNTYTNQERVDTQFDTRLETHFGNMGIGSEIKCYQLDTETPIANSNDISIKLSFPEKKFAKKVIISFAIETSPYNYKVRRTVSDFIWLRNIMKKFYPGVFIPPIANHSKEETKSDSKIEKKMLHYQNFLNLIAHDEFLKTSKLFFDFLNTPTENEFQLKAQAYEKIEFPKIVSQLQSKTGTITVHPEILDDSDRAAKTDKAIQSNVAIFTDLNKSFKELVKGMKLVSNSLYDISQLFDALIKSSKEYDDGDHYINQYQSMKDSFQELYYNNQKQTQVYDMKLKQHFKYVLKQHLTIKELRDEFHASKIHYHKLKAKLDKRKEELFKRKDIKNWELKLESISIDKDNKSLAFEKMLPNETQALFEEKQLSCFLGCAFENEFAKERELIGKKNQIAFQEIANNMQDINSSIKYIWEELLKGILDQL